MNDILKIAKSLQDNNIKEADAVSYYTETLSMIADSDLDEEKKKVVVENLSEIIADELNHQKLLEELYTYLTSIEAKED